MDSKSYLTLNSWLQKADDNYIAGRLLWHNVLVEGSSNLLWLSCEQLIKILLLQKEIGTISSTCSNLDEMHVKCEKKGKNFGHNVKELCKKLKKEYPSFNLTRFKPALEKLHEFFYRRYVVRKGTSIPLDIINLVDEFYFKLRDKVESDVGLGIIDEIFIQKKHHWDHPLPAFRYAYFENKSFRPRKHKKINYTGPDGKIYEEEGIVI